MVKYETIIEKHRGWQVIFRRNPQRYLLMGYTCLSCKHRISREIKKGRVKWRHYYISPPEAKARLHHICYCSCNTPTGPDPKEQMRAYKRLAYWKHQFQVHRAKFFEGKIGKRGN